MMDEKRETLRVFFDGLDKGLWESPSEFFRCSPGLRFSFSTFCRWLKRLAEYDGDIENFNVGKVGRPMALTEEMEGLVMDNLKELKEEYGLLTNGMIIREGLFVAALNRPNETFNMVRKRLVRVGGKKWVRNFKRRHGIHTFGRKRPYEKERAMKAQPEIVLEHFQNYMYIIALVQIDQKISEGIRVEGWVKETGGIVKRAGGTNDPVEPLVEFKDGFYFHLILQCRLGFPDKNIVWCVDEKPLIPDAPLMNIAGWRGQCNSPIACGRSSSWTVVLCYNAAGVILPPLLILRGSRVSAEVAEYALNEGISVTSAEKGSMTDLLFSEELKRIIPLMLQEGGGGPQILLSDGHRSRLTRTSRNILSENSIYMLLGPSHTSTITSALDNGVMARFQKIYSQFYTVFAQENRFQMGLMAKVKVVVRAVRSLRTDPNHQASLIGAWKAVGLEEGRPNPLTIDINKFAIGQIFRDSTAPKVTKSLLKYMFSHVNLAHLPGDSILIPSDFESREAHRKTQEVLSAEIISLLPQLDVPSDSSLLCYYLTRTSPTSQQGMSHLFRRVDRDPRQIFLQEIQEHLNLTSEGSDDEDNEDGEHEEGGEGGGSGEDGGGEQGGEGDAGIGRAQVARRLYISTNTGCIPQLTSVSAQIDTLFERRQAEEQRKAEATEKRRKRDEEELPMKNLLLRLGVIEPNTQITINIMHSFYTNYHLKDRGFPTLRGNREAKGKILSEFIQGLSEDEKNEISTTPPEPLSPSPAPSTPFSSPQPPSLPASTSPLPPPPSLLPLPPPNFLPPISHNSPPTVGSPYFPPPSLQPFPPASSPTNPNTLSSGGDLPPFSHLFASTLPPLSSPQIPHPPNSTPPEF